MLSSKGTNRLSLVSHFNTFRENDSTVIPAMYSVPEGYVILLLPWLSLFLLKYSIIYNKVFVKFGEQTRLGTQNNYII